MTLRRRTTAGRIGVGALFSCLLLLSCRPNIDADHGPLPDPPPGHVRVAGIVLKWIVSDKPGNYERIEPLIREAAANGAKIVVTTESFLDGYAVQDKSIPIETYRALGEPIPDGAFFGKLQALAEELDIHLVAGIMEADGELRFNTAAVIGPDGELVGKYHKQALGHELGRNTPGDEFPVFPTPYGSVGLMICADRRDESIPRRLRENGADFLICPSGGMFGRRNDRILQARSRENSTHIVFVHPAEFLVTAPDGSIVSRAVLGGDRAVPEGKEGTRRDPSGVFFFDLPLPE